MGFLILCAAFGHKRIRRKEGQEDQPPTNTAHDISSFLQSERCCGGSSCLFLRARSSREKERGKWRQAVSVLCFFFLNRHVSLPLFLSFLLKEKEEKERDDG